MHTKNYYKNRWLLIGVPASVILATVIGTPHTIYDWILYQKIGLNLIIGILVWLYYFWIIRWFDHKMPWEAVNKSKRWLLQLGISISSAAVLERGLIFIRNGILDYPFSNHLYFYTDLPIFFLISLFIHFLYYQWYISHLQALSDNVELPIKAKPLEERKQLIIRKGKQTYMISMVEIAYFYRRDQLNFLRKWDGKELIVDQSLAVLEKEIHKEQFFRVNRQLIVNRKAIKSYKVLANRQTELQLNPPLSDLALLNKNRSPQFKQWLKGN